jgi:hypothetical protein
MRSSREVGATAASAANRADFRLRLRMPARLNSAPFEDAGPMSSTAAIANSQRSGHSRPAPTLGRGTKVTLEQKLKSRADKILDWGISATIREP